MTGGLVLRLDADKGEEHQGDGYRPEAESVPSETQGKYPSRDRRTDIGTHYHADGVTQREESRIDEADKHQGRSRG